MAAESTGSEKRGPGGYYDKSRNNTVDSHDLGNIVVMNSGLNPVINYSFMIRVEGAFDLPCRSVKGFTKENEFDYIQEGGVNDYVHMRRKPISKPFTLQVERYVGVDYVDPLPLGAELILPLILFVNKYTFPTFKPVVTYTFTGCTVISKTTGELNAESSGLFVETTTIAYREMIAVKIPSQAYDLDEKTWSFLDGGSFNGKKGNGQFNRLQAASNKEYNEASNTVGEKSREQMIKKADSNLYSLKTDNAGGTTKKNHKEGTYGKYAHPSKSDAASKADERVYAINQNKGGRYLKSKESHTVKTTTALSAKTKEQMKEGAVLWNPKETITTGTISKEQRNGGKVNGSAVHSREQWDKASQILLADANKFNIHNKPSNANGSAKRNGVSAKEPAKTTMERKAAAKKYSVRNHNNKSAKTLGPSATEPTLASMERRARKHKYSIKDNSNKAALTNTFKSNQRELSMDDMAGKADANKYSIKTNTGRKAKVNSAAMEMPKDKMAGMADAHKYNIKSGANKAAKVNPGSKEKPKSAMEAAAQTNVFPTKLSANTKPMTTPEAKLWPAQSSAITKPMKKTEAKVWPKAESATKKTMKKPVARTWPAQASANKKPMKASVKRSWPSQASANTKDMKASDNRSWPAEASAVTKPMKNANARLWPQVKSAQNVTDFLKK